MTQSPSPMTLFSKLRAWPSKKLIAAFMCWACFSATCNAQQPLSPPALNVPPSADSSEFLKAADEVLAEMSKVLSLPVLQPLKKSVRSREEIRTYLSKQMNDD